MKVHNKKNDIFYLAGLISVATFLLADIVGGIITPNYNYVKNAVSELIQSGAEQRLLLSSILFFHALMSILFAIGIISDHPYKKYKLIYIGSVLYLFVGVSNALSSSIFPQDPIGTDSTLTGTLHLILVGVTVLSTFVLIPVLGQGFYKYNNWEGFRIFTYICYPVIIISGIMSPIAISKGFEIVGLTERIVSYTFYVWIVVLAVNLLKIKRISVSQP